jgi:hypothetical protein
VAYNKFGLAPIAGAGAPFQDEHASVGDSRMVRYVLIFLLLFTLGGGASAAAIATGAPASAQVVFLICLGLFAGAVADGVAERRSRARS